MRLVEKLLHFSLSIFNSLLVDSRQINFLLYHKTSRELLRCCGFHLFSFQLCPEISDLQKIVRGNKFHIGIYFRKHGCKPGSRIINLALARVKSQLKTVTVYFSGCCRRSNLTLSFHQFINSTVFYNSYLGVSFERNKNQRSNQNHIFHIKKLCAKLVYFLKWFILSECLEFIQKNRAKKSSESSCFWV